MRASASRNWRLKTLRFSEARPRRVNRSLHAPHLAYCKHAHAFIRGVVHIVHKQISLRAILARYRRFVRAIEVFIRLFWRVCYSVVLIALNVVESVAPQVMQIQPMSDLVSRG